MLAIYALYLHYINFISYLEALSYLILILTFPYWQVFPIMEDSYKQTCLLECNIFAPSVIDGLHYKHSICTV